MGGNSRRRGVAAIALIILSCPLVVSTITTNGRSPNHAGVNTISASLDSLDQQKEPSSMSDAIAAQRRLIEDAILVREEATTLHKAGDYKGASVCFLRAVSLLEAASVIQPPPALNAIRLSLAATQLKLNDLSAAEGTCTLLLKTQGLGRPLRQKAYYRRALARFRQICGVSTGDGPGDGPVSESGSVTADLPMKAYRDAYLALRLSQLDGGEGGDGKSSRLLKEMEAEEGLPGFRELTSHSKEVAKAKAEEHLASLSAIDATRVTPGGLFDILGVGGGSQPDLGFGMGGMGSGLGTPGTIPNPRLMEEFMGGLMGSGGRVGNGEGMGGGAAGGLMNMLMQAGGGNGARGLGPLEALGEMGGGENGGNGLDSKKMKKTLKKVSKLAKKQLRNPSTQQFVCSLLHKAEPDTLKQLASSAGLPVGDSLIERASNYLKRADGKMLESWVDMGEIISGLYRRFCQLSVLWTRTIGLLGLWLVWIWVKACFAPIV
ncbi:unnamed protein product [Discosporangium mesarthrocarpum]